MPTLRATVEGLSVRAIFAAVLNKDELVKISADETVAKAGANETPIGRVVKSPKAASGTGTVETKFKDLIDIIGSGALTAGTLVKMAAADGSGNQRVAAWVSGTDAWERLVGTVWKGGADGATIKVLTY